MRLPIDIGRAAFTFVEVIVLLVVVAILAVAAVPTFHSMDDQQGAQAAALEIHSALLYAQSRSRAGVVHRVTVDTADEEIEVWDLDAGVLAPHPTLPDRDYVIDFDEDGGYGALDITTADFGGFSKVHFDRLGVPSDGGTVSLEAGAFSKTVTVTAFTGEIGVQ